MSCLWRFTTSVLPQIAQGWQGNWPFLTCLDAVWSAERKSYHLLLADLTETHVSTETGAPPIHRLGEQLMEAYAQFHAFWWDHPALGRTVGSCLSRYAIDEYEAKIEAELNRMSETSRSALSEDEISFLRRLPTCWPQRRRERIVAGRQLTLVHRDPHPGNFLYPHDPAIHTVKLIDWQSWRVDPGTDDMAYLMAFHWPASVRAESEERLLRHYHTHLLAAGVKAYTWDTCLDDYRASILRFLGIMVIHGQHAANQQRLKRGIAAAIDWHCTSII